MRHVAIQQSESMRAKFMAEIFIYDPAMVIWIDESGFTTELVLEGLDTAFKECAPLITDCWFVE